MPERLWDFVTNVLSSDADVLEQVLAELAQLLPRTGAGAPQSDGRDYPPDYRPRRDMDCLGAMERPYYGRHIRQRLSAFVAPCVKR